MDFLRPDGHSPGRASADCKNVQSYRIPHITRSRNGGRSRAGHLSAAHPDRPRCAQFKKDLPGSDFLHWGKGELSISARRVSFIGELAPGPDYRLYLTPQLVVDEQEFLAVKDQSAYVGDIKTFNNFILNVPENINPAGFTAMVVWCETFGEFITAATYQ